MSAKCAMSARAVKASSAGGHGVNTVFPGFRIDFLSEAMKSWVVLAYPHFTTQVAEKLRSKVSENRP